MTFLNPLLLLGLAAAAIPLIIHLFNFRRPRRVDFSSLAFLHELRKSTMQRVRIKQWLLLALRTLTIVFLVMAFARPTITGNLASTFGGQGRTSRAIVLDNSASMALRDGSGSYIEQARTIAAAIVDQTEPGDEIYIIPTTASSGQFVAFQNKASARQSLLEIEAIEGEMSLSRTVRRAIELLEVSANPNREIYVLADQQRSTFGDSLDATPAVNTPVYLIPIGTRTHDNLAISGVDVLSRILSVGQVVRMEATLVNYSDRTFNDIIVSLYLDGERVSRATTSLGPHESTQVPIAVTPRTAGWIGGQVEIEDVDFRNDDVNNFTLFIPEERNVLVVRGRSANTNYIELALSGAVTGSQVHFSVDRIEESGLAQSVLGTYDTVVLAGVIDLTSGERAALETYVREGGGLLIFPGEDLQTSDYDALLGSIGAGQIESISERTSNGITLAGFGTVDVEHALFEGMFESTGTGAPRLEQPEIFRVMTYRPGGGSEQTLIRLSDDRSFLQEIRYNQGSVMLYAVAPENSWSDFPTRGLFIPLLYRSIYYLSAGGSVMGEQFRTGEAAQLRLTGVSGNAVIRVDSEDGDSYVPEVRRTPGGVLALIDSGFLKTGIYNVLSDNDVIRRFVVHPDPSESDLDTMAPEDGRSRLAANVGSEVNLIGLSGVDSEQIRSRLSSVRSGIELWNVFMLLALFTLIAEMGVEKKWRPEAA